MRICILQHTPNEGPGAIAVWAHAHHHEITIYYPYQFGILPLAKDVDMLVLLGGPMSPNDQATWIIQERTLINQLLAENKPLFGACFGAQQIVKALGYSVTRAPAKEVGWAQVYRQSNIIPGLPTTLTALHWHEEQFEIPSGADWLFSSDLVRNQGFVMNHKVVGLQFHVEPLADDVRTIVANDAQYIQNNALYQTSTQIIEYDVPNENQHVMNMILDYITN